MKTNKIPEIVRLNYKPGDLILKEGDFGISIYEIISGKVKIFVEANDKEIEVATQGPGDIIGGMSFLSGDTAPRTASARAMEACVIDAWHPLLIKNEYKTTPAIFKLISGQAIKRLVRMNSIVLKFSKENAQNESMPEKPVESKEKRRYYRKQVDLQGFYQPDDNSDTEKLEGRIIDISRGGCHLEVRALNAVDISHMPGDQFLLEIFLSDHQELKVNAMISNLDKGRSKDAIRLGMSFMNMGNEDKKHLGFFLIE